MMPGFSSDNGTLLPSQRLRKYPVNCTVSSHRKQNPERILSLLYSYLCPLLSRWPLLVLEQQLSFLKQ